MAVNQIETLKQIHTMLKSGTPKWLSHPGDYKAMVDEWHKSAREALLRECSDYRIDDQDILVSNRRTNMLTAAAFMRKLREECGLTVFSCDSQLNDGTASLMILRSDSKGGHWAAVCSLQVPLMWEWTRVRLDPVTQLPSGFRDIGWRSAVRVLIEQRDLPEAKAHEVFGKPRGPASLIYRRKLYEWRNGGKAA